MGVLPGNWVLARRFWVAEPALDRLCEKFLSEPALLPRRADKRRKQRMRRKGARFQFGMKLHADEPGMVFIFDDFRKKPIRRHAREAHAVLRQAVLVRRIDLIAMAMALDRKSTRLNSSHT